MKRIKVLGTWQTTYLVKDYEEAIYYAKKDMNYVHPNLNMKVKSAKEETS